MTSVKINWNPQKGDIIARLMNSLAQGTGWPISKEPDLKADINYFGLYIQVGQSPQVVRQLKKTAAYFSHYEIQRQDKIDWWNIAASKVNIRTTVASQYVDILKKTGETHLVYPPPIDDIFRLPQRKPRIGISGFVHPSGRKGEHLVKRLYEEMGDEWDIVASGKGWPVPNVKLYDYKDLPAFYQSLDVFLCTSITEGIPMPPLEALACGVPIVAPLDVGILEPSFSLNYESVFYYEPNDLDDMIASLNTVIRFGFNHYAFDAQDLVKDFTQEAWCKAHKEAFGMGDISITTITDYIYSEQQEIDILDTAHRISLAGIGDVETAVDAIKSVVNPTEKIIKHDYSIEAKPETVSELTPVKKAGAICVAYGAPSRNCARRLIPSWQKYMPDYLIALVSDEPINIIETLPSVFIEHSDDDIGARSVKTDLYNVAPQEWKYVLYLDADTEIIADVSQLFRWLKSGFDFIICTNPFEHKTLEDGKRPDNMDELEYTINLVGSADVMQPNGGVFGFTRNKRTEKFMNLWHKEWGRYGGRDQMALIRALHLAPVKWLLLGNEWNTILRTGVDLKRDDSAGILHHPMTARRWTGIVYGDLTSDVAWDMVRKWESENL